VHDKRPALVLVRTYRDGAALKAPRGAGPEAGEGDRPDPTAGMSDEERVRFGMLRRWRNEMARRSGKPPYLILTNRQAVEIAKKPPRTKTELGEVKGMGESRVEELGDELIALLASAPRAEPAVDGGVVVHGT